MTGLYFRFFNTYVGFQVSRHIHHNFQDNKLTIKFGRRSTDQTMYLISGHLGEGLLELLSDGLVLLLLGDELILQPVHLGEEKIMECSEKRTLPPSAVSEQTSRRTRL